MFRFISNVGSKALSSLYQATGHVPIKPQLPGLQPSPTLLTPQQPVISDQVRSVIKFSLNRGKRRTVRVVLTKFFRLHWGGWIRTRAGRHRKLWTKSATNRRQLKEHVLCNATQTKLLDRMVCEFWRRPKYYIEDPYAPYHTRENFWITRRKPWRPEGWE